MGYEIIYDRKFIKTSTGIVPLILCGSNNCAEYIMDSLGRERLVRERRWEFYPSELLNKPAGDFGKWVEAKGFTGNEEIFRFHNAWVTGRKLRRWLLNGVEAAATLEEYISWNPGLFLHGMVVNENSTHPYNMTECTEHIYTSEQLEIWLEKAKEKVKELEASLAKDQEFQNDPAANRSHRVRIDLCFSSRKPLRTVPKGKGAVVAKRGSSFVKSYIKNKELNFTSDPMEAAVFPSAEAAALALGTSWKLRYVSAENARRERPFVVRITQTDGWQRYLMKCTSRRYHFTSDIRYAITYASMYEAQKAAFRLETRVVWRGRHEIAVCNHITGEEETLDMEALRAAYQAKQEDNDAVL